MNTCILQVETCPVMATLPSSQIVDSVWKDLGLYKTDNGNYQIRHTHYVCCYSVHHGNRKVPSCILFNSNGKRLPFGEDQFTNYWGERERAPHRRFSWDISYYGTTVIRLWPSSTCRGWSHDVGLLWPPEEVNIHCQESLVLPDVFGVRLAFVVV